jgi:CubicO group peptidase (beta-lactamase class C family)
MKHVLERSAPRGVALVVGTGEGIWSRGVASDAVFEVGSISKTLTATLLAGLAGAGGIRSTAADMVAYLQAHARRDVPFADTHARRKPLGQADIGLAWIILPDGALMHDGGTGGFRSFAGISKGGVVVVLSSTARSVTRFGMKLLQAGTLN